MYFKSRDYFGTRYLLVWHSVLWDMTQIYASRLCNDDRDAAREDREGAWFSHKHTSGGTYYDAMHYLTRSMQVRLGITDIHL